MLVLFFTLIGLISYGVWEYFSHQKLLHQIPIRIHVNGTRGKSSVTRLIASGLRAAGIRTVGKVTGTLPRIIDLDGNEVAIVRTQKANIIEQTKILRFIQKRKPQALVIECMAVLPEYQWMCEQHMIHATIGVITNARLDHINEMGHFREQTSRSLSNTVPKNSVLYTSEKKYFPIFQQAAERNGSKAHLAIGDGNVTVEEIKRFSYIEHPDNVALALAVCMEAGVDRQVALDGMYRCVPDSGALRISRNIDGDKEVVFVNALAANDPESTDVIWKQIEANYSPLGKTMILLNSRADRQERSVQLIEMVANHGKFDHLILSGESLEKLTGFTQRYKIPKSKIVPMGWVKPEAAYQHIFDLVETKGTVIAIGNMGSGGIEIFRYFFHRRRIND